MWSLQVFRQIKSEKNNEMKHLFTAFIFLQEGHEYKCILVHKKYSFNVFFTKKIGVHDVESARPYYRNESI